MFVCEWVGFGSLGVVFIDEAADEFLEDVALESACCV